MGIPAVPRGRAALLCVAALLWASACADPDGGASTPTATSPAPTVPASITPTTATSPDESPRPRRNIIAWILDLGLGSPPGPATEEFAAYEALRRQDCDAALDLALDGGFSVVEAAARACLAAVTGDEALWSRAEAQRDDLAGAQLDCLEANVVMLLDRLLEAHASQPGQLFEFVTRGREGRPPCPRLSGLDPDHGPAGQLVTIKGSNLQFVKRVIVDFGDERSPSSEEFECGFGVECGSSLRLRMPSPDGATTAEVVIVADPGDWEMDRRPFRYAPDAVTPTPDGGSPTVTDTGSEDGA